LAASSPDFFSSYRVEDSYYYEEKGLLEDPEDIGFPYNKHPADIFWNRREEDIEYYTEGEDPTRE
jgi:hypothetical protein